MRYLNQYLKGLRRIEQSLVRKDTNPQFLEFWRGLVRDSDGRWLKYHYEGIKYFRFGQQAKPDLTSREEVSYIRASIRQNRAFLLGLRNESFSNFKAWLIKLQREQVYSGIEGKLLRNIRVSQGEHSRIVVDAVLPLAAKYHDPYTNKGTQIVYLPNIDQKGLPMDKWINEKEVIHYYPDPKFLNQYLQVMKENLEEITSISNTSDKGLLSKIALYYQYGINTHMFENINQSLFANQMNTLLQVFGFKPINHGILDFAAMRLQPDNFVRYFIDSVMMF